MAGLAGRRAGRCRAVGRAAPARPGDAARRRSRSGSPCPTRRCSRRSSLRPVWPRAADGSPRRSPSRSVRPSGRCARSSRGCSSTRSTRPTATSCARSTSAVANSPPPRRRSDSCASATTSCCFRIRSSRLSPCCASCLQPFTSSQARQALDSTRRVVIPLLEYLDDAGYTVRLDGTRRTMAQSPPSPAPTARTSAPRPTPTESTCRPVR